MISITDKQRHYLKYLHQSCIGEFNYWSRFRTQGNSIVFLNEKDEEVKINWDKEIKPLYDMDLIDIGFKVTGKGLSEII
jgi:hypothetical protein